MAPEVKTAKNSKFPKLPEKCFEPIGKGGWPPISTWIGEESHELGVWFLSETEMERCAHV
jgi:hypothetical protein